MAPINCEKCSDIVCHECYVKRVERENAWLISLREEEYRGTKLEDLREFCLDMKALKEERFERGD